MLRYALVQLNPSVTFPGQSLIYFNISSLIGTNGTIDEASYNQSDIIRAAAVSLKFKVITLVLFRNHSATKVSMAVSGRVDSGEPFKVTKTAFQFLVWLFMY